MDAKQANEDIRMVREMIEKTKREASASGAVYLSWGILTAAAIGGMHLLAWMHHHRWIWINWILFMGIGVVYTLVHFARLDRRQKVKTHIQASLEVLWFACGSAFLIAGFVFPAAGLYPPEAISVLMALIAGIGLFVTGGIVEWKLLTWGGVAGFVGALGMLAVPVWTRSLLLLPVILLGYILPGAAMVRRERDRGEAHDRR